AFRDLATGRGDGRRARSELRRQGLRPVRRACGAALEPAAAAARALPRRVPRGRHRLPLGRRRRTGKRMRALRLLVVALALSWGGSARAVVTGSIFGPGSQTLAIAVVPLESKTGSAGSLGGDFARVLSRDLDLSGYFKLVDPRTFVEGPGVAPEAIDYVGWAAIGTQELV